MDTKLVFCIECGEMVHLEEGIVFGHLKYIPVFDFDEPMGNDVDLCEFPSGFAFVAPPADEPDWIDYVTPPGDDELEQEECVPSGDFWMTSTQYIGL